jgi:phosphoribosylglycinamide formyltransferase-1
MRKKIAIFASGSGSNAQRIFEYFKDSEKIEIACIITNNSKAGVIERFRKTNIPVLIINKSILGLDTWHTLIQEVDLIVLAGFLLKIPESFVQKFKNKIINIHPSLLPKYGGENMYGDNVHFAVIANREAESGITIHFVDEGYDTGKVIFQATCTLNELETVDSLKEKIHALEHEHFPQVIAHLLA